MVSIAQILLEMRNVNLGKNKDQITGHRVPRDLKQCWKKDQCQLSSSSLANIVPQWLKENKDDALL